MEPQAPAASASASSQPSEPSQSHPSQPPSTSFPPSSSSAPSLSAPLHSSPNPNAIPNPATSKAPSTSPLPSSSVPPQPRPPSALNRNLPQQPQQQPQPHYPHFSSPLSSLPPASPAPVGSGSSFSSTGSPSISGPSAPRGGMAIGVPTHHQNPSAPFSSSFGQHFGGLGRTGVNMPDSTSNSTAAQVRAPTQGMGMLGSLGSSSQMRPGGMPPHQHRPVQSSLRAPSAQSNQSTGSQSFQGPGLMRASSVGSPASPSISSSQGMQSINQPWLSSGSPGKPPLPSASYRQHPPSLQQRSHIPPQQHSTPTASQQQPLPSNQLQEHLGQQVPSSRALHMPHQQQNTKVQGPGNPKATSLVSAQPSAVQVGIQGRTSNADADESCNRILSKRTIHELVTQVDPSEKLDPEVADVLVDIAENFLESITKSGCSLAKHRKSTMLEAKDILLHLEKNWNMSLPGFGGDEIKSYRRQLASDIHKERLVAIKKSMVATDGAHHKGSAGQASAGAKGSQGKTPGNVFSSPTIKNS
ncbi:transcription initiation factor TFIID subunit 12-like [Prosopis cineraria]|uniref:transcription initiation factor TFIID subunit 12-like n=1 Tax=Prosopis cineraria TaxID=364024 RepID=UPI002410451E|nr:transcription initiation factor TFIID subunit 12-like [Prosopis cineraria]